MEEKVKTLKERMEELRSKYDIVLPKKRYVMAMIDGRSFSSIIKKHFKLPFDDYFVELMNETAKYVCEHVGGCKFAYVQSDEITFVLTDFEDETTEPFFGNRLCKLQSIIPSMATAKFNRMLFENVITSPTSSPIETFDLLANTPMPMFDCKVWDVDNYNDVIAYIIWRQNDCIRNSKQQTTQTYLPKKSLLNKNTDEQIKILLDEKGIDWNQFNDGLKYGRFIYKTKIYKWVESLHKEIERYAWQIEDAFMITENKEKFNDMNIIPILKND